MPRHAFLPIFTLTLLTAPALADWSADPAQNTPVTTAPGEQVLPKIAPIPGGGAYVGWFSAESGNYNVRLQRLDAAGNPQWAPEGLLVSGHPSMTSLVDWDLIADASGNAALVFSDIRDGGDLDVHAYRIDAAGGFLWGPDGVAVSANSDYEPAPVIAQASDGDFVIVWARLPDAADGAIMMQRIAPDGTPRLASGGVPIASAPGEDPAFCSVVPSTDGGVIVSWIRSIATFLSPRHLRAQKFDAAAQPQWGAAPVEVYNAASLPIAYTPVLQPDGDGGAILAWHSFTGSASNCYVQRLDAAGSLLFPAGGVPVSIGAAQQRFSPSISFDASTGDTFVFWDERNLAQSAWGIYGQRLSPAGERLWTDTGRVIVPVNNETKAFVRSIPLPGGGSGGGAMVFWFRAPSLGSMDWLIEGASLDGDGDILWGAPPMPVSTVASPKDDPEIIADASGFAVLAWHDQRGDGGNIYAQNINPDGSLGSSACPADFDGSGDLTLADFIAFRNLYTAGDAAADFDNSGTLTLADFVAFRNAYTQGCD